MATPCGTPVHFCHMRIARLNANGTRKVGADNRYETGAGIEVQIDPIVEEGERFTQDNGCGTICAVVDDEDTVITGYTLTTQVCSRDFELMELMCGGTLGTSSGQSVAYADPDPLSPQNNGTIVELFQRAWDGDEAMRHPVTTASVAYYRAGFPKVKWRRGPETLAKGITVQTLIGKATPNIAAGLGIVGDWNMLCAGPRYDDLVLSIPSPNCGALPTLSVTS